LAAALVFVVLAIAATPFWAPAVIPLLPWGQPAPQARAAPAPAAAPVATAPDPALAAARAQVAKDEAVLQLLGQRVAALEARPAPDLSAIQQQLAGLAKTTADLGASVAALDKKEQAQPAADPNNLALALTLLQIEEAVDVARPFATEYRTLLSLARGHPEIAAAAAPLAGPAESGVASRAALAERLRELAPQIASAKPPPKPGWKSQIVARLRALVTIRRVDGVAQKPAEAAVSSAEHDVASGDLDGAVAALSQLTGPNAAAAEPWLQMARQRLAVEVALRQIAAALTATLGAAAPATPGKG
jgi:uroporphyrinogen-III synthase